MRKPTLTWLARLTAAAAAGGAGLAADTYDADPRTGNQSNPVSARGNRASHVAVAFLNPITAADALEPLAAAYRPADR